MPQIELSTTRGLVQRSGLGFVDSEFQEHEAGAVDLTAASTSSASRGAVVHLLEANGVGNVFKLFDKAQGATKGQIKVVILKAEAAGNNTFIIDNHDGNDLATLSALGDMAICIFDGTDWVVGKALA